MDLEELEPIIELPDYEGRDCFWYFQNYTLYKVLDVKIMDKFVQNRWEGTADVNCSTLEYSCSWQILFDKHDHFMGDDILSVLYNQIFTLQKGQLNHAYKFHVWIRSMQFRYMMEGLFTFMLTVLF